MPSDAFEAGRVGAYSYECRQDSDEHTHCRTPLPAHPRGDAGITVYRTQHIVSCLMAGFYKYPYDGRN